MRIDVLTLFPDVFPAYLSSSVLGRIQEKGLVDVSIHNIRDYATGRHRITDEPPFGGGGGMVLKPEPLFAAVEHLASLPPGILNSNAGSPAIPIPVVLLSPQGRVFNQDIAKRLSFEDRLILICGRYEGIDERVRHQLATEELSIGDFILTGGELGAMVLIDSISRLLEGALGDQNAAKNDSFSQGLLEGPHYTRPENFRGWSVPDVLRSGHAAKIKQWRREQSLRRTWQRRPDLLLNAELDENDKEFLMILAEEQAAKNSGS